MHTILFFKFKCLKLTLTLYIIAYDSEKVSLSGSVFLNLKKAKNELEITCRFLPQKAFIILHSNKRCFLTIEKPGDFFTLKQKMLFSE